MPNLNLSFKKKFHTVIGGFCAQNYICHRSITVLSDQEISFKHRNVKNWCLSMKKPGHNKFHSTRFSTIFFEYPSKLVVIFHRQLDIARLDIPYRFTRVRKL